MDYKKSILLMSILCFSCIQNNPELQLSKYERNYLSLITEYNNPFLSDNNSVKEIYVQNIHEPEQNFKLKYENNLLVKQNFNAIDGLPTPIFLNSPRALDYAKLVYVFNNSMWISQVRDSSYLLYYIENGVLRLSNSKKESFIYNSTKNILLNGIMHKLIYNKNQNEYYVSDANVKIKYSNLPIYFDGSKLISPITSKYSIWTSSFPLKYKYNKYRNDIAILLYNWEINRVVKDYILPSTGNYLFFNSGIGSKDSKEMLYLQVSFNFRQNYPGMTEGHIMIYDILNDTMYNIRHPIMQGAGEDEELLETNYILGEDENIYYQLVTDKAYYIYKIEPLWDEPMEETDYNPVFFEFYPELKAEWDKLHEQPE